VTAVVAVLTVLAICVAGGVGAALRFLLDDLIRRSVGDRYPVGTTIINLTGSLLLGALTGLTVHQLLPEAVQLVVGSGLLGGYTTFSTASYETVRLLEERRLGAALANGIGQLVVATAAAAAGFALAGLLVR
jgi:fluoride exporter